MKRKIWLAAVAVMLCSLVTASSAVAYFSYQTKPVINTITTGKAKIELREEDEWTENRPLNPGETLDKTPTVANVGTIMVYVRIRMVLDSTTAAMLKDGQLLLQGVNTSDWTGMPSSFANINPANGVVITATLKNALAPGEVSPPLFTGVSLAEKYVEGDGGELNITLIAEAVQTIEGKTPAQCWGLL